MKKEINQKLAQFLRHFRQTENITQSQLAEILQISQSKVSKLEQGLGSLDAASYILLLEFKKQSEQLSKPLS